MKIYWIVLDKGVSNTTILTLLEDQCMCIYATTYLIDEPRNPICICTHTHVYTYICQHTYYFKAKYTWCVLIFYWKDKFLKMVIYLERREQGDGGNKFRN